MAKEILTEIPVTLKDVHYLLSVAGDRSVGPDTSPRSLAFRWLARLPDVWLQIFNEDFLNVSMDAIDDHNSTDGVKIAAEKLVQSIVAAMPQEYKTKFLESCIDENSGLKPVHLRLISFTAQNDPQSVTDPIISKLRGILPTLPKHHPCTSRFNEVLAILKTARPDYDWERPVRGALGATTKPEGRSLKGGPGAFG